MYANVNGVEPAEVAPANDLDRWALSRLAATVDDRHRAAGRVRRDPRRPGDRRVRRRPLELVRAPLAPPLLGRRPGRVLDAAHLPGDRHEAARAVRPVHRRRDLRQPRRLRAVGPPRGLAEGRRARRGPRVRDGDRPRDGPARPGRARPGEAQGPPAAARRRRRRRRRPSAPRSSAWPTSRSRSSTSRSCATSRRPTSSAPTRSSPTTARSARASASRCRRSRPPSPPWTRSTSPSALRDGGRVGISIDGHDHELDADDLMLAMKPLDGYQLEREGSHAVALELELDDALKREGLAREIVHAIQAARKSAGPAGRGPDRAGPGRRRPVARSGGRARGLRGAGDARCQRVATTGPPASSPCRSRGSRCTSRFEKQSTEGGGGYRRPFRVSLTSSGSLAGLPTSVVPSTDRQGTGSGEGG